MHFGYSMFLISNYTSNIFIRDQINVNYFLYTLVLCVYVHFWFFIYLYVYNFLVIIGMFISFSWLYMYKAFIMQTYLIGFNVHSVSLLFLIVFLLFLFAISYMVSINL